MTGVWSKLLILDFGVQVVGFGLSYAMQTEKFYDLTGSATYLALLGLCLKVKQQPLSYHQMIHAGFVGIWATRYFLII